MAAVSPARQPSLFEARAGFSGSVLLTTRLCNPNLGVFVGVPVVIYLAFKAWYSSPTGVVPPLTNPPLFPDLQSSFLCPTLFFLPMAGSRSYGEVAKRPPTP